MTDEVKNAPATALPWKELSVFGRGGYVIAGLPICKTNTKEDAAYITHSANAYPRLVDALRKCYARLDHDERDAELSKQTEALLRELGELA